MKKIVFQSIPLVAIVVVHSALAQPNEDEIESVSAQVAGIPVDVVATVRLHYSGSESAATQVLVIESHEQMLKELGEAESKRLLMSLKDKSLDFKRMILFVALAGRQATGGRALTLSIRWEDRDGKRRLIAHPYSLFEDRVAADQEDPSYHGSFVAVLIKRIDDVDEIDVWGYDVWGPDTFDAHSFTFLGK